VSPPGLDGIFVGVRAALIATAAVVATAAGLATPTGALARSPSPKEIRAAVHRAQRSSALWATINICSANARHPGGEVGVRGQMPALGFSSTLAMTVRLGSWSMKDKRFVPLKGSTATERLSLGPVTSLPQQAGAKFDFTKPAGLLDATIEFSWTRAGKVLGHSIRTTTAGHRDADFGQPAHYSAAHCRLG
jgi:hypothetical protein